MPCSCGNSTCGCGKWCKCAETYPSNSMTSSLLFYAPFFALGLLIAAVIFYGYRQRGR